MSARGSTAKISSLSSMSPPVLASRVCTLTFILAFLAFVGVGGRLRAVLGRVGGVRIGSSLGFSVSSRAGFLLGGDRRDFLVAREGRDLVNRGLVDQASLGNLKLFDLAA